MGNTIKAVAFVTDSLVLNALKELYDEIGAIKRDVFIQYVPEGTVREVGMSLLRILDSETLFVLLSDSPNLSKIISDLEKGLTDRPEGLRCFYIILSSRKASEIKCPDLEATHFVIQEHSNIKGLIDTLLALMGDSIIDDKEEDVEALLIDKGYAVFASTELTLAGDTGEGLSLLLKDETLQETNINNAGTIIMHIESSGDLSIEDFDSLINGASQSLNRDDITVVMSINDEMDEASLSLSLIVTDLGD